MKHFWETGPEPAEMPIRPRAVAYYRHSAQDRQENSIPLQQQQVQLWADQNGVEIIHEFKDAGCSGLTVEEREGFTEMMEEWVKKRTDFKYVLCLDVSRWGRFQDIDRSAQYSAECKQHGKIVIYTSIGMPRPDDPMYPFYVHFERFRAARYSYELSDKVWRGCIRISEQGYWAGGPPPYALLRLLLDEKREPLHTLDAGQRKGIQNQRVTLTAGDPAEVAVVQRIFREFVELGHSEYKIAEGLNDNGIRAPAGGRWGAGSVRHILDNEKYAGAIIYNRTTKKLKTKQRPNEPEKWIRTPDAFDGLVTREQFDRAQQILAERRHKYDPDRLLRQLDALRQKYDLVSASLLRSKEDLATASTYARHFGSLDLAFQQLFPKVREQAREQVHQHICQELPEVLTYSDFLVLGQKLTLSVQPIVPVSWGYSAYWPLRRDKRPVIDLTLGVLLGETEKVEILGYVVLPRWLASDGTVRFTSTSPRTELFGRTNLKFLDQLM